MNPHQKNKVDVKSLSPEEQRLFRLYGKLPSRSDHFAKHLNERKYFDSGDYAMSKAGKGDGGVSDTGVIAVGSQHPNPEDIPHLSSPVNGAGGGVMPPGGPGSLPKHTLHGSVPAIQAGSPIKESSYLQREVSGEEGKDAGAGGKDKGAVTVEPLAAGEGIPIRR